MDPYEVLGVSPADDVATIRSAYLMLARRHHPDSHAAKGAVAGAAAEQRMREINAAWSVLGDRAAKRRYDDEQDGPPAPAATIRTAGRHWTPRGSDNGWMDDFEAWRNETDDFVPAEAPRSARQQAFTVLPVVLFGVSMVIGFIAVAMNARPLMAASFLGVMASVMLLFVLTMLEMRGRGSRSR